MNHIYSILDDWNVFLNSMCFQSGSMWPPCGEKSMNHAGCHLNTS